MNRLTIHGIVLGEIPYQQDGWAHVASARRVAAIGARAASQAGYTAASDPVRRSTIAAVVRLSRRGTKKENAAGSPGKLVRMPSRYRAVAKPRQIPKTDPSRVRAIPSYRTSRTMEERLMPIARSVAISPNLSLTVMVKSVPINSTVTTRLIDARM